jgi:hypothetical protein
MKEAPMIISKMNSTTINAVELLLDPSLMFLTPFENYYLNLK